MDMYRSMHYSNTNVLFQIRIHVKVAACLVLTEVSSGQEHLMVWKCPTLAKI